MFQTWVVGGVPFGLSGGAQREEFRGNGESGIYRVLLRPRVGRWSLGSWYCAHVSMRNGFARLQDLVPIRSPRRARAIEWNVRG